MSGPDESEPCQPSLVRVIRAHLELQAEVFSHGLADVASGIQGDGQPMRLPLGGGEVEEVTDARP